MDRWDRTIPPRPYKTEVPRHPLDVVPCPHLLSQDVDPVAPRTGPAHVVSQGPV
jgi:hypothetical protein